MSVWKEKQPETLHSRFNNDIITDDIELIINNYYFQFDNKITKLRYQNNSISSNSV